MDNARKKYVNIERLSSGGIFALLDSIESNDEGDIENIINDSDTEFVPEDESVISTNIIRKEEISDQSSFVSISETSIHILSTQSEDATSTLGQDKLNFAPETQCTSNQSPSPATQLVSNQSASPANKRTADQSPAAVITRRTSDQSSKSTPPPTVTLPKNTIRKKYSVLQNEDKTKKKPIQPRNGNVRIKKSL